MATVYECNDCGSVSRRGQYGNHKCPNPDGCEAGDKEIMDEIMRYEQGDMDDEEIVSMFQRLVDSGLAWMLQGSYGRMAQHLILAGLVKVDAEKGR